MRNGQMSDNGTVPIAATLTRRGRWGVAEILFWAVALASLFLLPERLLFLNEIAVMGLFALSLDLILGYAGIISLGHAAFFGFGAYVAGLLAKHAIINEPVLALLVAGFASAALGFLTSFLVLRGSDLTRLMVTLGVALDVFSFDRSADILLILILGGTGYLYGGLIGAVLFRLMQDYLANLTPQYWQFWIGLVLVAIVLVGRDRLGGIADAIRATVDQ